jgi:antitoxin ParD1/3/4
MTITLTKEQQAWISAHVAKGEFSSPEAAVRQLVDERIAEITLEEQEDLAWALPQVEEGLAALERGDVITVEEHKARNASRLSALKR